MRIQVRQTAGERKRYTPGAFNSQIGQEVPIMVEGSKAGDGELVMAEVVDDGRAALLTYEIHNARVAELLRVDLLAYKGPGLSFRMVPAERS